MIRELDISEVPLCHEIGRLFFNEGKIPGEFVPEEFTKNWTRYMGAGMAGILGWWRNGELAGVLGALLYPDLNNSDLVAAEAFWFVKPEHRGAGGMKLLFAYLDWAKQKGAKRCTMVHLLDLTPDRLAEAYMKVGFRPMEVHYIKEL
jgi:GNAT superfamily N-acetyltransferase